MADASGPGHSYDGSHDVNTILSLVSSCVSWAWQLVNTIKFLHWAPELGESFACCNMLKYDEICETMLKHNAKKNHESPEIHIGQLSKHPRWCIHSFWPSNNI